MVRHDGREGLRTYLRERDPDAARVELHMLLMEPFFVHAENEHYSLGNRSAHEDRLDHLVHAIAVATDDRLVSAELVDVGFPGLYSLFLNSAWKKRLARLSGEYATLFGQRLHRAWHGREGFGAFKATVDETLWQGSLETSFRFPSRVLNDHVRKVVKGILFTYLSYAATGSAVGAKQLAPLVSLLADTIPLGENDEWPGSCLFLVE